MNYQVPWSIYQSWDVIRAGKLNLMLYVEHPAKHPKNVERKLREPHRSRKMPELEQHVLAWCLKFQQAGSQIFWIHLIPVMASKTNSSCFCLVYSSRGWYDDKNRKMGWSQKWTGQLLEAQRAWWEETQTRRGLCAVLIGAQLCAGSWEGAQSDLCLSPRRLWHGHLKIKETDYGSRHLL